MTIFDSRQEAQNFVDKEHHAYVSSQLRIAGKTTATQRGEGRKVIADCIDKVEFKRWKIVESTVIKRW